MRDHRGGGVVVDHACARSRAARCGLLLNTHATQRRTVQEIS